MRTKPDFLRCRRPKTAIWTRHHPSGTGKRQIMTPSSVRQFHGPFAATPHHDREVARQAHAQFHAKIHNMVYGRRLTYKRDNEMIFFIVTLASPPPRMVKFDPPPHQPMGIHQFGGEINRHLVAVSKPFPWQGRLGSWGGRHRQAMSALLHAQFVAGVTRTFIDSHVRPANQQFFQQVGSIAAQPTHKKENRERYGYR